jgi:hypothetical protein
VWNNAIRPPPGRLYSPEAMAPPLAISNRLLAGLSFTSDTGVRSSIMSDAAMLAGAAPFAVRVRTHQHASVHKGSVACPPAP